MCLYSVDSEKTEKYKAKTKSITAYKVVSERMGEHYPLFEFEWIPFKKGINVAQPSFTYTGNGSGDRYKAGFHAYLNYEDASENIPVFTTCPKIIKIQVDPKDIICVGTQSNSDVIVASRMIIKSLKEVSKK